MNCFSVEAKRSKNRNSILNGEKECEAKLKEAVCEDTKLRHKIRNSILTGEKECEVKPHGYKMHDDRGRRNSAQIDKKVRKSFITQNPCFHFNMHQENRNGNKQKIKKHQQLPIGKVGHCTFFIFNSLVAHGLNRGLYMMIHANHLP